MCKLGGNVELKFFYCYIAFCCSTALPLSVGLPAGDGGGLTRRVGKAQVTWCCHFQHDVIMLCHCGKVLVFRQKLHGENNLAPVYTLQQLVTLMYNFNMSMCSIGSPNSLVCIL